MEALPQGVPAHTHTHTHTHNVITVLDMHLVKRLQPFNHYAILKSLPPVVAFNNSSLQT